MWRWISWWHDQARMIWYWQENRGDAQLQTNIIQLTSFLGLVNVYRSFIGTFTGLRHQLNEAKRTTRDSSSRLIHFWWRTEEVIRKTYRQGIINSTSWLTKSRDSIPPWMKWKRLRNRFCAFSDEPSLGTKKNPFLVSFTPPIEESVSALEREYAVII